MIVVQFVVHNEFSKYYAVVSLGKLIVQFLAFSSEHSNHVWPECFASLMEAYIHLKEVEEAEAQESDSQEIDVESEEETSYDEVTECSIHLFTSLA